MEVKWPGDVKSITPLSSTEIKIERAVPRFFLYAFIAFEGQLYVLYGLK
jgi:hypothetical protein